MVGREFHNCTSLQHGKIGLHLCLLYCLVLTVEIGPYIQMLSDDDHSILPSGIHSTPESRTMGRYIVQGSLQQLLVLKHSTLHMGRCGHGKKKVGHLTHLQPHIQPHTGMLCEAVPQQCR